jgi:hypothetical protein
MAATVASNTHRIGMRCNREVVLAGVAGGDGLRITTIRAESTRRFDIHPAIVKKLSRMRSMRRELALFAACLCLLSVTTGTPSTAESKTSESSEHNAAVNRTACRENGFTGSHSTGSMFSHAM